MAKVTFRRGSAQLYKERWEEYSKDVQIGVTTSTYAYLNNAIYFAEDSGEIYMNGQNYTFDSNVDLTNILSDVEFNENDFSLTFSYSDVTKTPKTVHLYKVVLKTGETNLTLDVSTGLDGSKKYEIGLKNPSQFEINEIEKNYEERTLIENGDTISEAFSKINDALQLIELEDDWTPESEQI